MPRFIDKEIRCPFCKACLSVYERRCGACASDVSLLSDVNLLPHTLFNAGLLCRASGDTCGALVQFAAAVALQPGFVEAHAMLAHAAAALSTEDLAERHRRLGEGPRRAGDTPTREAPNAAPSSDSER